jgi:hypothetical protein
VGDEQVVSRVLFHLLSLLAAEYLMPAIWPEFPVDSPRKWMAQFLGRPPLLELFFAWRPGVRDPNGRVQNRREPLEFASRLLSFNDSLAAPNVLRD